MEIYIEYALLENFFVDGTLLFLALKMSKQSCKMVRLLLLAGCMAFFAVFFPLVKLPPLLFTAVKLLFPLPVCLVAVGRKGVGRYALTVVLFYALAFAFGGALIGVLGALQVEYFFAENGGIVTAVPVGALFAALTFFSFACVYATKKLYAVKRARAHIAPCELVGKRGRVKTLGYLDTGNSARYKGLPVCFVSPDIFYDACGEGWEQMTIHTLAGEKTVTVCIAELSVNGEGKSAVYASPSARLIGREYKVLLPKGE
jgi:hypothetical protein